jgi:hypothetical protein
MITGLEEIKCYVLKLLTNLQSNFKNRFAEPTLQQHEWMRNSFAVTTGEKISSPSIKAKISLIELLCDTFFKIKFQAFLFLNFVFVQKRTLGTLTTSHRDFTTFWKDISI